MLQCNLFSSFILKWFNKTNSDHPFQKGLETLDLGKILVDPSLKCLFSDKKIDLETFQDVLKREHPVSRDPFRKVAEERAFQDFVAFLSKLQGIILSSIAFFNVHYRTRSLNKNPPSIGVNMQLVT